MSEDLIDLNEYSSQSVVRRYFISGTLRNLHGEHNRRGQTISLVVFAQEDKERQLDDSSDSAKQKTEARAKKRTKDEEVHSFPVDEEGNLLVPLGGPRGYIMGALKTAMNDLYKDKMKDRNWEGFGVKTNLDHGVFVEPDWVPVGKEFSNPRDEPLRYMVQTKGLSGGMMTTYYDFVKEADFNLTIEITNTKIPEHLFLQMLAHVQRLGIGPKGRGSVIFNQVKRS